MSACAGCGAENRQGRKFCAECGAPLGALTCPACAASNVAGEKFCGECGAALQPPAQPAPAAVPAGGERKHITVLFADVAGSMDLQEQLDAEVWAQIMGRFVSILAEGVRKFGGTVDKFTGDGIMALFGAPVAQEDHARRACHAAWHLTNAIGEYSEELRQTHGVELNVRLGLNSGEVVLGRVGEDVTIDPTALGHTVGLAQRMEATAEPGKAYLTERTARLVEGWFRLDELGPRPVRGAREPLRVYELAGPLPSPPVLHGGGLGVAPLVERERELAVLQDALAMAEEGHAQVVGVVGEAGVGKSRLCEEFARSCGARGVLVRRTAGVSHGRDLPLLPILSLLRDYFGISEVENPEQSREKVAGRLLALDADLGEALPLLFDFLEIPDPDRPSPQLAPEARMRRVIRLLQRGAQLHSEREVLVFEDLHWFDRQSEAFLEHLVESLPGSRTLVVTSFRPEFTAAWMRHPYYKQLSLAPLSRRATTELLGGLLGPDLSLAPLVSFVLERTGGNPFFVEEVVRALIEDETLTGTPDNYRLTRPLQEVHVPPSVQAVLAARVDRLPAEQKSALQTAAVLGREFPSALLADVMGMSGERLETILSGLCGAELLQEVSRSDLVREYRFRHPLTQEVAYSSLLTERRVRLHGTVAKTLIDLDPNRLDERAALVASNFDKAGDHLEAARWNARAGAWVQRSNIAEAERCWRGTVTHLTKVPESEETLTLGAIARARLLQLGSRRGISLAEAEQLFTEGRALGEHLADPGPHIALARFYSTVRTLRGEMEAALAGLLEAARLGDETGDLELQAGLWSGPAMVYTYTGPLDAGLAATDAVLALCDGDAGRGAKHLGYSPMPLTLHCRARMLARMGRLAEAHEATDRALDLARQRCEVESIVWALATYPDLAEWVGEDDEALARAEEAVSVAEESSSLFIHVVALHALGMAELGARRWKEASTILGRALGEARDQGAGLFEEPGLLAHLARALLGQGDDEAARRCADEAVSVALRQGARVAEGYALLTRAHVLRATGSDHAAALADLDTAHTLAGEIVALAYEPQIREERGRLLHHETELKEALRLYRQIGATGHARRLEAELAPSSTG